MKLVHATPSDAAVYSYSFKPDLECRDLISQQFQKASELYNEIIEIIRGVHRDARTFLIECAGPKALALNTRLTDLTSAFDAAKAVQDHDEQRRVVSERRRLWADLKPLLAKVRAAHRGTLRERYYVTGQAAALFTAAPF